jgi:hypothetical protein
VKASEALKRQGQDCHLWLETRGEVACQSKVGATSSDIDNVTCENCRTGRIAEDTVTGPYGKPYVSPPPAQDSTGQMELL